MAVKNEISEVDEFEHQANAFVEEFVKMEMENATYVPENETEKENVNEGPVCESAMECEMCGKHFYKKHLLEGHLRKHCGLKVEMLKFKCFSCWN